MLVVVLYGLFKITQTLVSIAKIAISTSLSCPVPQFFGNAKTLVVVLYSFFEIIHTVVSISKIFISTSLSCSVLQFFGNAKLLVVVFKVFFRINVTLVSKFLATVVTTLYDNFYVRVLLWRIWLTCVSSQLSAIHLLNLKSKKKEKFVMVY